MSGPDDQARRVLIEAPADLLLDRLAAELTRRTRSPRVELFQVDYRLAVLLPLTDG